MVTQRICLLITYTSTLTMERSTTLSNYVTKVSVSAVHIPSLYTIHISAHYPQALSPASPAGPATAAGSIAATATAGSPA